MNPLKMNPLKINELLKMVLSKVPMQTLLPVRSVCSHWKLMIEALCAQKLCLKLYCSMVYSDRLVALSNRFVGTIKIEQFVQLKLKRSEKIGSGSFFHNPLKADFCAFLGKIFPRVDQLIVDLNLDAHSATNLQNLIEKCWKNLNTLSVSNGASYHLGTIFRINKQLKRVDLSESLRVPHPELFAQLEHFSCANSYENNLDKLPPLGPNCTSFCWGFALNASASVVPLDRWIRRNSAQVLSNITHLGLFWVNEHDSDNALICLICSNFHALQVLSVRYYTKVVFNSATFVQLAKLSHLNTLCLGCIQFDLNSLESNRNQRTIQLSSIRVLNLVHFHFDATLVRPARRYTDFEGDRFCRILANIFPNTDKLGIFSASEAVRQKFRDNLRHFSKFLKFKILNSTFDSYVY